MAVFLCPRETGKIWKKWKKYLFHIFPIFNPVQCSSPATKPDEALK